MRAWPALTVLIALAIPPAAGRAAAPAGPRMQELATAQGLPSPLARALDVAADGTVWVALRADDPPLSGLGLTRIEGARITHFRGKATGLESDDVKDLLVARDGTVWAATGAGLHRLGSDGKFQRVGGSVPLERVGEAVDGTIRAAAGDAFDFWLGRVVGDELRAAKLRPLHSCRHHAFRAIAADKVWLVCDLAIIETSGDKAKLLKLKRTPLNIKDRGGERRMPPTLLYDSARAPDGAIYLLGGHKSLVRYRDGRFESLVDGHFSELGAGASLFVSDFDGKVSRWDGKKLERVFAIPGGGSGSVRILAQSSAGLWLVCEPRNNKGHELVLLPTPVGSAQPVLWPLRRGGTLSPGVIAAHPDGRDGLWLSTNDGLWHATP